MNKTGRFSIFGTTNWRSYALYVAGCRAEDRADTETAETLYVRALAIDAGNNAARMNLGGVLLEENNFATAVEQLRVAKQKVPGREEEQKTHVIYYSASYRLASALYNLGRAEDAKAEIDNLLENMKSALNSLDQPPRIGERAEKLLGWMESRQIGGRFVAALRRRIANRALRKHPRDENLRPFLEQLRPSAISMRIGLGAELGESSSCEALETLDRWRPEAWFQYNLACTYSMVAGTQKDDARTVLVDTALKHLDFALKLRPALKEWASQDPSLATARDKSKGGFIEMMKRHAPPKADQSALLVSHA